MTALKITLIVFGIIIGIIVLENALGFYIAKRHIFKSGVFKKDYQNKIYWDMKRNNRFAWLCTWITNLGIIYLISFIVLKIIK